MRRIASIFCVLALSLLTAGAALAGSPVTVLQAFNPALGQLPESITTDDDGNLYFSMGGTLQKYTTDHRLVTVAQLPIPVEQGAATLGVKVGPDGYVYVVSASFNPALSAAAVWRVSPTDGQASLFVSLPQESIPNDLVFDAQGNLYLTDSAQGQIWKVDPDGNAEVWFADPLLLGNPQAPIAGSPLGANGIAFDRFRRHLYVVNTDYGRVVRIGFRHGQPKGIQIVTSSSLLVGADGIAFDALGDLYVAVNASDRIAVVSPIGAVFVLAEGGPLDAPSSLAFGAGRFDRHALYLTNFAILRFNGVKPGTPQPSLAAMPVLIPGLALGTP
jgi:sugar lactone lactonase YvrE